MQQALVSLPELVFAVQPLEPPRAPWAAEALDATAAGASAPFAALIAALEQAAASGESLPPGGNGLPPAAPSLPLQPADLTRPAVAYAAQPGAAAATHAALAADPTVEPMPALAPTDPAGEAGSDVPADLERAPVPDLQSPPRPNALEGEAGEVLVRDRTLPAPHSSGAPTGASIDASAGKEPTGDAPTLERGAVHDSAARPAAIDTSNELYAARPAPPRTEGERAGPPAASAATDAGAAELIAPDGTRIVLGGPADGRPQLAQQPTSAPATAAVDDGSAAAARAATRESVAEGVRWMVDHRVGEARLTLNPPELGTVDVKISLLDDQAHVQLVASTAGAREDLEQSLPRLRELLAQSGLELADASVSGGREERRADAARASPFGEPLDPLEHESHERAPTARRAPTTIDVYA